MNPDKLIDSINKSCKNSIDRRFNLAVNKNKSQHNLIYYVIDGTSSAVNRFDIPQESVKVLDWFNNFWLYLEIRFSKVQKDINGKMKIQKSIRISLSVFQGKDNDNEKYQLFRAEWDDYNSSEEKHAQPHWHITSSQAIENTFYKYADTFEKRDFLQLLETEIQNVFDVKKIHFAMNGNWENNDGHIHKIKNEQQIVRWLQGIFSHLRTELEFS
jgi:hypothetical protein